MRSARLTKLLTRVVHGGYEATEMNDEDLPPGLEQAGSDDEDEDGSDDSSDDASFDEPGMDVDAAEDDGDSHESEEYSYSLDSPTSAPSPKPAVGPSRLSISNFDDPSTSVGARSPKRTGRRTEVDDDFFALDEFNQQADDLAESRGLDDDDLGEDEVDLFAPVGGLEGAEDNEDEDEDDGGEDLGAMGDIMSVPHF